MTDPIEIENCADDDVLSFHDEICKISKFRQKAWQSLSYSSNNLIHSLKDRLGQIHDLRMTPNGASQNRLTDFQN